MPRASRHYVMRLLAAVIFALTGCVAVAGYAYADACVNSDGGIITARNGPGSASATGSCSAQNDGRQDVGDPIVRFDCGVVGANLSADHWDARCGAPRVCPPLDGNPHPHPSAVGYVGPSGFVLISTWCPGTRQGQSPPTARQLRDQVTKLLPRPRIGVAPPTGRTLVNLHTLYWVDTEGQRDLGTAPLLGATVRFRARFLRLDMDFGDGNSDSTTDLPRAYDRRHDCGPCEERFGHTYTKPGPVTVRAIVSWAAQVRVNDGPWLDIPGQVAGNPTRINILVRQARALLVKPR